MKKTLLFFAMLLSAIVASAKDVKTVVFTTNPIMHCANCENKIKTNLRFEKGVKQIDTNVAEQRVTVSYDPSKTNAASLQKAFGKFGYEAKVVGDKAAKGECKAQAKGSCCQAKAANKKEGCGGCQAKAADKKEGCGGCQAKAADKKAEGSCCQAKAAEKKEGCGGCKNK